jgi:hypothetical protein
MNHGVERVFNSDRKEASLGKAQAGARSVNMVGRAPNLPESQSHFAFVDATTSTTPHFRLIAVNLNH